jgi:cytochrome c oxidase subunit II
MNSKPYVTAAMVIILAAFVCCADGCKSATCTTGAVTTAQAAGAPSEGVCRVITMTAKRFSFNPSTIVVNEGDNVRIEITSVDVAHGFNMPDYKIDLPILPGVPQIIEFTADKPGTHEFHCDLYCGFGHEFMRGKLIVTPRAKAIPTTCKT